MKTRLYFDNCCFNRIYDEPSSLLVQLEAKAIAYIQNQILLGKIELVWSFVLDQENENNPHEKRRTSIEAWKALATVNISAEAVIYQKLVEVLKAGIKGNDALHVACAIQAQSRYFLTTDKKLLKKQVEGIIIMNPMAYLLEEGE